MADDRYSAHPWRRFAREHKQNLPVKAHMIDCDGVIWIPYEHLSSAQAAAVPDPQCADPRCQHPQGWHRRGVGSCLECGCLGFVLRCPECGAPLEFGHDCLSDSNWAKRP